MALHGRLPRYREEYEGILLGRWVTKQRTAYKQGTLAPECAAALEAVRGFTWNP